MKRHNIPAVSARAALLLLVSGLLASGVFDPVPQMALAEHPGGGHDDEHGDDRVRLSTSEIQEFDIRLAVAGPGTIRLVRKLPAEVRVNENRLAHIVPRYAGIATEVRVDVGDEVRERQVLAVVESDDSLAPYDMTTFLAGTVIEKHMTRGEPVSRERDGFLVVDLSSVWIDITVYQRDLDLVAVGQRVTIQARAGSGTVFGDISYITPVVDEHTRTATARLVLENTGGQWRPGMFVMAEVLVAETAAAVAVPATAVHTIGEQDIVFVETADGFEPRPVVIGRADRTHLEIVSGLILGESYAADGGFTLKAELGKDSFGDGHGH